MLSLQQTQRFADVLAWRSTNALRGTSRRPVGGLPFLSSESFVGNNGTPNRIRDGMQEGRPG